MREMVRIGLTGWSVAVVTGAVMARFAAPVASQPAPLAGEPEAPAAITLDRDAVTLEKLLAELEEQADLRLAAGPEVRWDEVSLFVRGRPAARVRAELGNLLNYTWEQREGRRPTVRQDAVARAHEENLRRRWFAGAAGELLDYASLARRPPEYYRDLKKALGTSPPQDPRLRRGVAMKALSNPARHATLRLLLTLSDVQIRTLVIDEIYYLPWREMSPFQQELALQIADRLATPLAPELSYIRTLPDARRWVREMGVVLTVWFAGNHFSAYYVVIADVDEEGGYGMAPREAVKGSVVTRGRPYPPRPRRTTSRHAEQKALYEDLERMPFPARGLRQTYPSAWPDVFRQLGERLPFALYSDYFPAEPVGVAGRSDEGTNDGPNNPPLLPVERMSVAAVLDALCTRHGRIWWREGDALFFRSRTWFLDRLCQVPPPVLAALQQELKWQGKLDRQAVDLLAALTRRQLIGIQQQAREARKRDVPGGMVPYMYSMLRLYRLLTNDQKARVLQGAGLPFLQMLPAQQRAYREALFLCRASPELLEHPPPFRIEQAVLPGVPALKKPALGELAFFLADGLIRQQHVRGGWPRLADLYIPFPVDPPERPQRNGEDDDRTVR